MIGKYSGSSSKDPAGFDKEKQYVIKFIPGKNLLIYSEDKSLDVKSTSICDESKEYFLYVDLWSRENSCTKKLIS